MASDQYGSFYRFYMVTTKLQILIICQDQAVCCVNVCVTVFFALFVLLVSSLFLV